MQKISAVRERKGSIRKTLIVIVAATILTTLGIRAADRYFLASVREATEPERCPQGMVFITSENGGFCIDKYENSPGSKCPNSDPKNQTESSANLENPDCEPVSVPGVVPWRNISQNQAALACAKAKKRLATNKEWLQAALGTPDPSSGWVKDDCNVSNNWKPSPGPTGSGAKCVSSAGVYDMVGNVWEWVEGTIFDGSFENHPLPEQGFIQGIDSDGFPYETSFDNPNPEYNEDYFWIRSQGVRAIFRGGYWDSGSDAGVYSMYLVVLPSFSGTGVGFRCVK
jgi:formylglycine-generating enzyme required for sulfatase activity